MALWPSGAGAPGFATDISTSIEPAFSKVSDATPDTADRDTGDELTISYGSGWSTTQRRIYTHLPFPRTTYFGSPLGTEL